MKKNIILSIGLLFVLLACDKDEADRNYARISQSSVQGITNKGVTLMAQVYDAGDNTIKDHGFVYNLKSLVQSIEVDEDGHLEGHFEKQSLGSKGGDGFFESTLTRNLIKDSTYLAKAFLVCNGLTVYGESMEFVSQGGSDPVIASFEPEVASFGDTLKIVGNNFSNQIKYNTIKFGDIVSKITYASDTVLKAVVPTYMRVADCFLHLKVGVKNIRSLKKFNVAPPQIDSLSVKYILSGRKVDVYGKQFNIFNSFYLADQHIYWDIYKYSDSHFQFKVPANIPLGKLDATFKYLGEEITIPGAFESTKPSIESIKPLKVFTDTIFQIRGTYLESLYSLKYFMGGAQYFSDSLIEIKVQHVPGSRKVYGMYNNDTIMAKDSIEWLQPVIKLVDKNTALDGEWITVYGDRFVDGLVAQFGEQSGRVNFIDKNTIKVEVPEVDSGSYPLKFNCLNDVINVESDINITIPEIKITSVSPSTFKRGDIIEVYLENMNKEKSFYTYIDESWAHVVGVYDNYIRVKIKNGKGLSDSPSISINNGGRKASYSNNLVGKESWVYLNETEDFYPVPYAITSVNGTPVMLSRTSYFSGYELLQFKESSNSWKFLSEYNDEGTFPSVFSSGNTVYCAYFDTSDYQNPIFKLKSYLLDTDEWTLEGEFKYSGEISGLFTFQKDNVAYIGNKEMMKAYDLETKEWSDKTKIPTNEWRVEGKMPFVINNRCFVRINNDDRSDGREDTSEFWEYNTNTDSWTYIEGCPVSYYVTTYTYDVNKAYFFIRNGDYMGEFLVFDPLSNTWENYLEPFGRLSNSMSFTLNNYIYFGYNEKYSRDLHLLKADINNLIKVDK